LTVARERIALKSQSRGHPRIRKTAIDPLSLKKVTFTFEMFKKRQISDFSEVFFGNFPKISTRSFYASLGAFLKRFLSWTTSEESSVKIPTKENSNQASHPCFFGKKFG